MNLILDSFAALLLCSAFFLFFSHPVHHYGELREYQLTQDFLQVTMEDKGLLAEAKEFCLGKGARVLAADYGLLLSGVGGKRCFKLECAGREVSSCVKVSASEVCGSRLVLAGSAFTEYHFCLVTQQPY
ncbi:MAG: hypothetical protein V1834_00085 [Candidatus Micrarchaeota archaeon]